MVNVYTCTYTIYTCIHMYICVYTAGVCSVNSTNCSSSYKCCRRIERDTCVYGSYFLALSLSLSLSFSHTFTLSALSSRSLFLALALLSSRSSLSSLSSLCSHSPLSSRSSLSLSFSLVRVFVCRSPTLSVSMSRVPFVSCAWRSVSAVFAWPDPPPNEAGARYRAVNARTRADQARPPAPPQPRHDRRCDMRRTGQG